jgi:hypothetical protein
MGTISLRPVWMLAAPGMACNWRSNASGARLSVANTSVKRASA